MARDNMIKAVERELQGYPETVEQCATAELARQLAREFDAGDRPAAGPLMRALKELRLLANPPRSSRGADADEPEEVTGPDELDELARARAARIAAAEGVVSPIGGHERRRGGAAAR